MAEPNLDDRLSTEEGKKKAEALFTKKFRDYLTTKTSSTTNVITKTCLTKDYSTSSEETTASESSRKSGKKHKKKLNEKPTHWDYRYAFRNRLTQCSLLKNEEEVAPPDELKPLLVNITILLQDLKQSPSEYESLYNLISKITILATEFIRRPLKKIQEDNKTEHFKNVDKITETIIALLNEYKHNPNVNSDISLREFKRYEKEIETKNEEIAEIKKQLPQKTDNKTKDLNLLVKNRILENERLKSEIKFNQSRVKKYKKLFLEKEWTKHKLELELEHLRNKISKGDVAEGDGVEKMPDFSDVLKKEPSSRKSISPKNKMSKMRKSVLK